MIDLILIKIHVHMEGRQLDNKNYKLISKFIQIKIWRLHMPILYICKLIVK